MKYLSFFDKQGIDLQVFLTLTEPELKEVGITLVFVNFSPKYKLSLTIFCISKNFFTELFNKIIIFVDLF